MFGNTSGGAAPAPTFNFGGAGSQNTSQNSSFNFGGNASQPAPVRHSIIWPTNVVLSGWEYV